MNVYLIRQTVNDGYDTYDSSVVIAESHEVARGMIPVSTHDEPLPVASGTDTRYWVSAHHVHVLCLGTALPGFQRGVMCASFNRG